MEEEKKEVVEAEVVETKQEEAPKQEQQEGMTPNCKNALIAFIMAVVGFVIGFGWLVGAIAGIVLGILALSFLKKIDGEVEKQPFTVFSKTSCHCGYYCFRNHVCGLLNLLHYLACCYWCCCC